MENTQNIPKVDIYVEKCRVCYEAGGCLLPHSNGEYICVICEETICHSIADQLSNNGQHY